MSELYIPPAPVKRASGRDPKSGRFLKGFIPKVKGKKWEEYYSQEAIERMKKGWKNLRLFQPKTRPDISERRKPVIGLKKNGKLIYFGYSGAAAKWCGGNCVNVRRCCRWNLERKPFKDSHGRIIPDKFRTYKGIEWFFESDNYWMIRHKELNK